jgi:DeoR family transcriptional regulator, suf operon transcriptional repressor
VKTSRQRVLEYIRTRRVVGVAELSRVLKMTPANARHHLSILQELGLVRVVGQTPLEGRGRPAQLFSLSEQVESNNLERLSAAAIDELLVGLELPELERVLGRLAMRLYNMPGDRESQSSRLPIDRRPNGHKPGRSLTQAFTQTVQRLNELQYEARWEAHAQTPRLILGHCPYAAILPDHPELCQMDARLLELMLGREVAQSAKLAQDPQGGTYCLFVLNTA